MAVYPASLPLATVEGYGYKDVKHFIRTDMDSGLAKQRLRFTSAPTNFNIRFIYNQTDLDTFEQFWNNTIGFGVEWFDINLSVGAGQSVLHTVRFIDTYDVSSNSNKYTVTGTIESFKVVN